MNRVNQKWGFGMSPISPTMMSRYLSASESVLELLASASETDPSILASISEVKGMFNRTIRKDQWDWFSVYTQLGEPPPPEASSAVQLLSSLRSAVQEGDHQRLGELNSSATAPRLRSSLETFVEGGPTFETDGCSGWVYVLSTRQQPDFLKIGMTTRSVSKRVDEINRATGIPIPYSARAVYRVRDAVAAERAVHLRLGDYRIRSDREFFNIGFNEANREIIDCLAQHAVRVK